MIAATASSTRLSGTTTSILHFGQQADVVLLAAIDRGYAPSAAVAADFGHRHAREADRAQRFPHIVDLVGRTMALISFISCLQHRVKIAVNSAIAGSINLAPAFVMLKHVDRLLSLGRDQHEVDVAAMLRDDAADAVQQAERVVRDDVEDRVAARRVIVRRESPAASSSRRRGGGRGRFAPGGAPFVTSIAPAMMRPRTSRNVSCPSR